MTWSTTRGPLGRSTVGVAALVAAVLAGAVLPAGAALADGSAKGGQSPAVVGPLLQILTFGDEVGVPTGCQLGSSTLGAGSAELGLAQKAAPLIVTINDGCTTVQGRGATYLVQGRSASQPLAAWNPYVNPVIGQAADSVTMAGIDDGEALAPFGGTIAGLGGTLNFFQGH